MKMIVVALAFVALAAAGPVPDALVVPETIYKILRSEFEPKEDGSYSFDFETENKIQRQEVGELKSLVDEENKPHDVVIVRGSYSYINDLGEQEVMNYWADETGFHAEGPSVPRNAESAARR
ncbi:larval cuticle protein 1-like [Aricia agestis]|uniref:larval cuticle protein 1-like n=1 Tax=Aricia agestis TaxID=91739 RepID=UPI001C203189|nr:larval cuticle protein 1-like [Aricia agestis]